MTPAEDSAVGHTGLSEGAFVARSVEEHNLTLGMGPRRFFLQRRMSRARAALRLAGRDETTVAKVASGFGFLELGRFAVRYRALFGESPSETLRGAPRVVLAIP